jgi:hypothetical protein
MNVSFIELISKQIQGIKCRAILFPCTINDFGSRKFYLNVLLGKSRV